MAEIAEDKGEIVFLRLVPTAYGCEDGVGGLIRGKGVGLEQKRGKAVATVEFASRVSGFNKAIGIKQETIAVMQGKCDFRIGREVECSQHQAILGNIADSAIAN